MLKKVLMGAGAAAVIIAAVGTGAFANDDGSLDLNLGNGNTANENGGLNLDLSKDGINNIKEQFKIDRTKPLKINIPGIININYEFKKDKEPDCQDLYKDMVKSGTKEAKDTYHKECLDD